MTKIKFTTALLRDQLKPGDTVTLTDRAHFADRDVPISWQGKKVIFKQMKQNCGTLYVFKSTHLKRNRIITYGFYARTIDQTKPIERE